jgi:osmotically inducible protein OsmC
VTSEGGRKQGRAKSSDGTLDVEIDMPKSLGGDGQKLNPELLFAAAYSTCFASALEFVAEKMHRPLSQSRVTARVSLLGLETGGFQLAVTLQAAIPDRGKEDAQKLMEEAHKICPYSKATRGNIDVTLEVLEK